MLVCSMLNIWYTPFVWVCLFCVCFCGAVIKTGQLIVSWVMIAQGYMLVLLGDVTYTVSSCQPSGCVCVILKYVYNLNALCWHMAPTIVWNHLEWYLSMFVYKLYPLTYLESVYRLQTVVFPSWFVLLHLCKVNSLLCGSLESDLCKIVNSVLPVNRALPWCSQPIVCWLYQGWRIYGQIRFDSYRRKILQKEKLRKHIAEVLVWQGFVEVCTIWIHFLEFLCTTWIHFIEV